MQTITKKKDHGLVVVVEVITGRSTKGDIVEFLEEGLDNGIDCDPHRVFHTKRTSLAPTTRADNKFYSLENIQMKGNHREFNI